MDPPMAINPERLQTMQELGLTEYEARSYLALLDFEVANASKIARVARVPRTKIYQALEGLEAKRLIKVIPERPKRYVVVAFETYLDGLKGQYETRARDLEAKREGLVRDFSPKGRIVLEDAGGFLSVSGRGAVTSKIQEVFEHAEREILILATPGTLTRLSYHHSTLEEKAGKGIQIRILVPPEAMNSAAASELSGIADVRPNPVPSSGVGMFVADRSEVLMAHFLPDDSHYFNGDDVGVWSDDEAIVQGLRVSLDVFWHLGLNAPKELLESITLNIPRAGGRTSAPRGVSGEATRGAPEADLRTLFAV
ncbi:MAG: TrmB family transcriptional regulator [Methanobacteriota archaeon]